MYNTHHNYAFMWGDIREGACCPGEPAVALPCAGALHTPLPRITGDQVKKELPWLVMPMDWIVL